MSKIRTLSFASIAMLSLLSVPWTVEAGTLITKFDSVTSNWLGVDGTPFVVSAEVPFSTPTPVIWACDIPGCDPNASGANRASFSKTFSMAVDPDATIIGNFRMMADDLLIFTVNGHPLLSAVLQKTPSGIPIPLEFSIYSQGESTEVKLRHTNPLDTQILYPADFTFALTRGLNEFRIDAYDGYYVGERLTPPLGVTCDSIVYLPNSDGQGWCVADRGLNWLYVQGSVESVPEPVGLALAMLSIGALTLGGRRLKT